MRSYCLHRLKPQNLTPAHQLHSVSEVNAFGEEFWREDVEAGAGSQAPVQGHGHSSCAVLGARQLQAAAGALERAALAGDWTAVAGGLAAARQAWSRLEGELARRQLP